jgi:acyl-CoA reductase-like NAD-dependent aldehyde dehydrogenase
MVEDHRRRHHLNRSTRPPARCWAACTYASSQADYDTIVERAQAAFKVWRTTPAPRRGEAIRLCAEALRKHKDALGSLVALEMGKIKPEGDGEVQEMIDIGDFAVGLSRQLYGNTMHSERPGHRMYEQWHPLGIVGVIIAFNFPVAVWAWNSVRRRGVRRHHHLEALAEDPAVGDRLDEDLQRRAEAPRPASRTSSSCSTTAGIDSRRPSSTTSASR